MGDASDALERALKQVRPTSSWLEAAAVAGVGVWTLEGEDEWLYDDPPEEFALPPRIEWPDEIRSLALAAYGENWDRFLEPGQFYVMVWPPRAELSSEGSWYFKSSWECEMHGDYDEQCPQCVRSAGEGVRVVDRPAYWSWQVDVETWALVAREGQMSVELVDDEDSHDWYLGTTEMDPYEVEYGPHRNSPDRQFLYRAAARL